MSILDIALPTKVVTLDFDLNEHLRTWPVGSSFFLSSGASGDSEIGIRWAGPFGLHRTTPLDQEHLRSSSCSGWTLKMPLDPAVYRIVNHASGRNVDMSPDEEKLVASISQIGHV